MTIAFAAQKAWLMNATLQENILFSEQLHTGRYFTSHILMKVAVITAKKMMLSFA